MYFVILFMVISLNRTNNYNMIVRHFYENIYRFDENKDKLIYLRTTAKEFFQKREIKEELEFNDDKIY